MRLHIVPAHPDRAGGLKFIASCEREYIPFSLALGTIVAGGVANRVLHLGQSFSTFKLLPLLPVGLVLFICAAPLCVFYRTLRRAKRQGVLGYGALAAAMGRQFERKWIASDSTVNSETLEVQDFSATTDLYSVAANVYQMKFVPVGVSDVTPLIAWTLVPAIPVLLASVPFEIIAEKLLKLLP